MILQKILRFAQEDLARVELEIQQQLNSEVDQIGEIGRYLLLSGGKRIRPILLLLTAKLAGYGGERVFPLSAMIEFMHTATLLHDDVIDHSHLRRGYPTVNSRWGSALSILVGDFLYAKAMTIVVDDGDPQILKEITRVTMTMTEGQVVETLRIGDTSLTEAEYRQIIRQKTAALFGACCYIGGVLGALPAERTEGLRRFGITFGSAFQLVDDTLDFIGKEQRLGKPVGSDLREGKVTLPIIVTLQHASPAESEVILRFVRGDNQSPEVFEHIVALIQKYDGIEYTLREAGRFVEQAELELQGFADGPVYELLMELADFIVKREV
ncbi:MAG TPA: polyprenyl synthetase family protein [Candidatus Tectomicrobia bacterium]|nr:polyprenyl synthetase family protein [Candidatus Tectomicrobia bacterium]